MMTILYSDLDVRVYKNNGKYNKNIKIHYQNIVLLSQYSDRQFIAHYQSLLKKLHDDIKKIKFDKNDSQISGSLCKLFM